MINGHTMANSIDVPKFHTNPHGLIFRSQTNFLGSQSQKPIVVAGKQRGKMEGTQHSGWPFLTNKSPICGVEPC